MFTRPADLPDDEVRDALVDGWGLDVASVDHAPVGFGSHHWWVASRDGRRWFATADDLRTRAATPQEAPSAALGRLRAALTTAAALHEHGLGWVVAPRKTLGGAVVVPLGEAYALSLHPRVEGATFGWGPYEDPAHRATVLDRLVELHTVPGCRAAAGVDDLGRALVTGLAGVVDDPGEPWSGGPFAADAWRLLVDGRERLRALVDRFSAAVERAEPGRFVLTHGEPHRGNTVVTDTGVVLVDWDTCLLAPPERDLWVLAGEDPAILRRYEERTGTHPDRGLLDAYRLRWDLADVAAFLSTLGGSHRDDDDTRTAWAGLRAVLEEEEP